MCHRFIISLWLLCSQLHGEALTRAFHILLQASGIKKGLCIAVVKFLSFLLQPKAIAFVGNKNINMLGGQCFKTTLDISHQVWVIFVVNQEIIRRGETIGVNQRLAIA